jgi:hypothetical protein
VEGKALKIAESLKEKITPFSIFFDSFLIILKKHLA